MLSINYCGKEIFNLQTVNTVEDIKRGIYNKLGIRSEDYYLLSNGKHVNNDTLIQQYAVHIIPRLVGGKGGFGSMLRAIGAQIEKTTNREACRDLSGRRLRDINEEKRLKTWIAQQVEREKEAEDRRQKKLERLCRTPKHEFKDEVYEKERSALPEKVEDALSQGLKASSSCSGKRKNDDKTKKNKKAKLWMGSDEEFSSSEGTDSEGEEKAKAEVTSEGKDSSSDTNEDLINPDAHKNDQEEVNDNKTEEKQKDKDADTPATSVGKDSSSDTNEDLINPDAHKNDQDEVNDNKTEEKQKDKDADTPLEKDESVVEENTEIINN